MPLSFFLLPPPSGSTKGGAREVYLDFLSLTSVTRDTNRCQLLEEVCSFPFFFVTHTAGRRPCIGFAIPLSLFEFLFASHLLLLSNLSQHRHHLVAHSEGTPARCPFTASTQTPTRSRIPIHTFAGVQRDAPLAPSFAALIPVAGKCAYTAVCAVARFSALIFSLGVLLLDFRIHFSTGCFFLCVRDHLLLWISGDCPTSQNKQRKASNLHSSSCCAVRSCVFYYYFISSPFFCCCCCSRSFLRLSRPHIRRDLGPLEREC